MHSEESVGFSRARENPSIQPTMTVGKYTCQEGRCGQRAQVPCTQAVQVCQKEILVDFMDSFLLSIFFMGLDFFLLLLSSVVSVIIILHSLPYFSLV